MFEYRGTQSHLVEVEILHEKGTFDKGLPLDVKPARGYELQPGKLVGQASQTKRDEIWNCLMNAEVLCPGVWGRGITPLSGSIYVIK